MASHFPCLIKAFQIKIDEWWLRLSAVFNRSNIIHMTTSMLNKKDSIYYSMHNIHDNIILITNCLSGYMFICESLHFVLYSHVENIYMTSSFRSEVVWGLQNSLTSSIFIWNLCIILLLLKTADNLNHHSNIRLHTRSS
jgi:hypothetical protein